MVRQFLLPNPFECFGNSAIVINWIAGFVLAPITYLVVGVFYDKGSAPVIGSVLYLIVYIVLTAALCVMGIFSFAWWWILILVVICIVIVVGIKLIDDRLEYSRK